MARILFCLVVSALASLTVTSTQAANKVNFGKQVLPIFEQHCISCHGEKKGLGKLRIHSVEALQNLVKDDVLVAGKPDESELYTRLILAEDHKKRMPKKAAPLEKDAIELVRLWIEQGAVFASATSTEKPAEEPAKEMKKEEPAAETSDAPTDAISDAALAKVAATGALVLPLSSESNLLYVNYSMMRDKVGDEEVAALADSAGYVAWLNLSNTKITDATLELVGKCGQLSQLHLEGTAVTDAGLANLANASNLEYLNLYETNVTDAGIKHLHGLKNLKKLYLWKTKVSFDAAEELKKANPELMISLGWNHPEVAKRRLEKQLAQVTKDLKEATAQEKAAAKAKEVAMKREAELKKQLEALVKPAAK